MGRFYLVLGKSGMPECFVTDRDYCQLVGEVQPLPYPDHHDFYPLEGARYASAGGGEDLLLEVPSLADHGSLDGCVWVAMHGPWLVGVSEESMRDCLNCAPGDDTTTPTSAVCRVDYIEFS